ncbi:MAG: hypothetical protein A3D65_01455 [Candidatus Lloydbacteria bacterium RIFCSPHIGHO2_02_FULL_50_13]|uniref:Uncharacterized protein n=1 Tax=Candidatus Lloydbacteria bacterium RIFCSPHIGHO2_02_FULL_50_13 TaxID=1798661 RepID=A0A1G2D4B1_9BACT|nr:MAG: hypothetical protein A3D65_01455 [Candidatus Lloydbacteria bacterium RIFCSPHIGHO2_02_FULL_50_13]
MTNLSEHIPKLVPADEEAASALDRLKNGDLHLGEIHTLVPFQKQEEKEEEERYQQYLKDHHEPELPQKEVVEIGPKIAQFEKLLASFESTYSLAELHAIIDPIPELLALFLGDRDMSPEQKASEVNKLASQDAKKYRIRAAAKEALIPIVELRNLFRDDPRISSEQFARLEEKYMRCSRAVGVISNNKVDHQRKGSSK